MKFLRKIRSISFTWHRFSSFRVVLRMFIFNKTDGFPRGIEFPAGLTREHLEPYLTIFWVYRVIRDNNNIIPHSDPIAH